MSRRNKILLWAAGSFAALLLVLSVCVIVVVQTPWFAQFARSKIISAVQDASGGSAEIGGFELDPWHLTVKIRDFVLHGKEARNQNPLFRVKLVELRLKLFTGWTKPYDIRYLGVTEPQFNVVVLPDGTTNIPEPKTPSPPSQTSGLETVVNLAVNEFRIAGGTAAFLQEKTSFSGRGENLRVTLNYDAATPGYIGSLGISPLIFRAGARTPFRMNVSVPVRIERDTVRISNAQFVSGASNVTLSGALDSLKTPSITARLSARIALPELASSFDLPIDPQAAGAPKILTANLSANYQENSKALQLERAHLALGATAFDAAGRLDPSQSEAVQFRLSVALPELMRLLRVSGMQVGGELQASGRATVDRNLHYAVDGRLNSRGLSVSSGATELRDITLASPFHADPFLISLDGFRLDALGGSLAAKLFLENLRTLSVEGQLRSLSIPVLLDAFTGKHLGYDGAFTGSLRATADLKARQMSGYAANADLRIVPGYRGMPLSGHLQASYSGKSGALNLGSSYLQLPHSRLNLAGSLNREIDLNLRSEDLSDFLPAVNFGSAHPQTSLPVVLEGGAANLQAKLSGKTTAPIIDAHLAVSDFSVEHRRFGNLSLDAAGSASGAHVQNGKLNGRGFVTDFDASIDLDHWAPNANSPVVANLTLPSGDLGDLAKLGGLSQQASGAATADIHVRGTYGNPVGAATFQVNKGSFSQQPFQKVLVNVALEDQLVRLSTARLDLAGGSIEAHGTFQHPRDSLARGNGQVQLAVQQLQLSGIQALAQQNAGIQGVIQLTSNVAVMLQQRANKTDVEVTNVTADLAANHLQIQNQDAGQLTATARTNGGRVIYQLASNFAQSDVKVKGATAINGDFATVADASVKHLSIAKLLQITGQSTIPASGDFSADAHFNGTMQTPNANLNFALLDGRVYHEPLNSLRGRMTSNANSISVQNIDLEAPAGHLGVSGSFTHPSGVFDTGSAQLKIDSSDIDLARIRNVQLQKPGLGGTLHLLIDAAADVRRGQERSAVLFSRLNSNVNLAGLSLGNTSLGSARFEAHTVASKLTFSIDSNLLQSKIQGGGTTDLTNNYPCDGKLSFSNIRYSNLAPVLATATSTAPPFEALVEGGLTFNGPLVEPDELEARLQFNQVDFQTNAANSPTGSPALRKVELHNDGPIVLALHRDVVQVESFRISGRKTMLEASGAVNLKDDLEPLALNLNAAIDLGLLQDANRDFYSSGSLTMNTSIRGSFAQPRANGRIELKNANINYAAAPNGLSNANGVILLNGTNASIEKLTGESGGGQIALTGFVGLGSRVPSFNLKANVNKVRVRDSGISLTLNANLALTGNTRRSLLSGTVTVERIAYASSSDAGSLLSAASIPPPTPASPNPLLAGLRLDVHILTAPDIQVVSTYANRLSVLANLTLRGTAENPGMLGRLTVTDGQLVFFGNTYTVTTGTVNFYDPNAIAPNLNFSLQTDAQGVNVTIGVSGLMDDLKLSYRSDPPLSFEQIVQLLATNTTPANPVIAAHQPTPPQQSFSQLGESAVLGQAVANPLASRVQRVFGLTQFKIDPSFSGNNGSPSARVTLQQKIASNITFTYITDVSQTNAQIVRVQWDLSNNLSAVGLRDYNGNVSIEFFYKFKRR